jgi:hypothetical protein
VHIFQPEVKKAEVEYDYAEEDHLIQFCFQPEIEAPHEPEDLEDYIRVEDILSEELRSTEIVADTDIVDVVTPSKFIDASVIVVAVRAAIKVWGVRTPAHHFVTTTQEWFRIGELPLSNTICVGYLHMVDHFVAAKLENGVLEFKDSLATKDRTSEVVESVGVHNLIHIDHVVCAPSRQQAIGSNDCAIYAAMNIVEWLCDRKLHLTRQSLAALLQHVQE